jgi:hypothetical protein
MCPYGQTVTFGFGVSPQNFFFINVKKFKKKLSWFRKFKKIFFGKNNIKKIIQLYREIMRPV